ncbi:MAG: uracil-DNA glycosylase family protein [Polaromonas sp.]|uniref:uracil-DNA glycosylase family protein n=1 Tax=Polaromonas sp. TaxID=1869339 RepID=UPI002733590B|nr:uracil-DNA glycosylase family protein [Polaromonas sp.]MDP3796063.1 uracil-DNA glycosylase family protein [Polaromonas sp.]
MSLSLDKRQRAMLREMGVRVWLPQAPDRPATAEVEVESAMEAVVPGVGLAGAAVHFPENRPVAVRERAVPAQAPQVPAPQAPPAPRAEAQPGGGPAGWRVGAAQALYAEGAQAHGARWLVLAETPAAALQAEPFSPFLGDAGKLLDNMLRAARLNQAGVVLLAPLVRLAASGSAAAGLQAALADLAAHALPDVVLVMGRLAAQAVLQSTEPLGKLRGQVHSVLGASTIVTYDATYLLRNPADKAKAWEDLCLAMRLARSSASPGN